jgi:hypothetical protein
MALASQPSVVARFTYLMVASTPARPTSKAKTRRGRTVRPMRSSSARSAEECSGQLLVDMAETATLRT